MDLAKAAIAVVRPAMDRLGHEEDRTFALSPLNRYQGKVDLRESPPEVASMRELVTSADPDKG